MCPPLFRIFNPGVDRKELQFEINVPYLKYGHKEENNIGLLNIEKIEWLMDGNFRVTNTKERGATNLE